jgi:hypothetical protein
MSITMPTGALWVDLALFAAFFVFAGLVVTIGTATQQRGKK